MLALLGFVLIVVAIVLFAAANIGIFGLVIGVLLGVALVCVDRGGYIGRRL